MQDLAFRQLKPAAASVGRLIFPFLREMGSQAHMSYSLNSLKGGYIGDYIGDYYRGYYGGY